VTDREVRRGQTSLGGVGTIAINRQQGRDNEVKTKSLLGGKKDRKRKRPMVCGKKEQRCDGTIVTFGE